MLRLQEMSRQRAKASLIGHGVEVLFRERFLEGPLDRVVVDLLQRRSFTKRARASRVQRLDVGIIEVIVPVEHDVVGVKRHAVGPLSPFDEVHRQLVAIRGPLPALGKVRHRLQFRGLDLEQRTSACQAFVHADVDAAPALDLPGREVPPLRPAADDMAHDIAIGANAVSRVGGLEDHRLLRQAILHRRQLARVDEVLRHPIRLVIGGQCLVLQDVTDADVIRQLLRLELRRIGRCRRLRFRRQCGDG